MLFKSLANHLTQKQQNNNVAYLGLCFLILILSMSHLQIILSTLCEELGFYNLGQTAVFSIYAAALLSTPFTSVILKKIGYNKAFVLCSLGYILFDISGLIMVKFPTLNSFYIRLIVCLGAATCGFCSSIIWVAQSGYINQTATQNNKSKLFALFWSFVYLNQIISNLLGTLVLGKVSTQAYFYMMTSLAVLSFILFIFVPKVQISEQQQSVDITTIPAQISVKQQLLKILQIVKNKKYKYLLIYFMYPGMSMAFYSTYLYRLIKLSISPYLSQKQSIENYNSRFNISQGLVFVVVAFFQVTTGFIYRKYSQNFNKFTLASIGTVMAEIAGLLSLVCYFVKSYKLCFVVGILWGICDIFMQTNTAVIVSIVFKNKIEGFTVNRIFFCIGVTSFLLMNILLSGIDISVFLIIFIAIQTVGSSVSMNLKYLSQQQKKQTDLNQSNQQQEQKIVQKSEYNLT